MNDYRSREHQANAKEQERRRRWSATGTARVSHPGHKSVVVPCSSKLTAIMNAAEVWGCCWYDVRDAQVWATGEGEKPVKLPAVQSSTY